MDLSTVTLPVFTQLAGVKFEEVKASVPQYARGSGLFVVEPVPANTGNQRQYTEIDSEEYPHFKGEGDQSQIGRVVQGYTKTLTSYRTSLDLPITYEMRTQNKYPEVIRRLTSLGMHGANGIDLDLSHRIGFGTATSMTDRDGRTVDLTVGNTLSLFSTVHTLSGSATTFRNRLANNPRASRGALEAIERQAIENGYNHLGEKVTMTFDIIWTTDDPNTVNTVREYLKSVASPDAVNAGVTNVYSGKYRHVVLPRLATTAAGAVDTTKRYYWGIASSMHSTAHLAVWEEPRLKTPSEGNNGEDFSTDNWQFGTRAGYGICIVTGNWIHFSSGDGTA